MGDAYIWTRALFSKKSFHTHDTLGYSDKGVEEKARKEREIGAKLDRQKNSGKQLDRAESESAAIK